MSQCHWSELQSILPLLMLMGGGGTKEGEQEAMNNMLPMILMMMDDNEVDADGNPVRDLLLGFLVGHVYFVI